MPLAVNSGSAWAGHREELAAAVGTENSWKGYFFGNNHFSVGNKTRMMGRNLWGGDELKPEVGGRDDACVMLERDGRKCPPKQGTAVENVLPHPALTHCLYCYY